jgi:hypothetical protein
VGFCGSIPWARRRRLVQIKPQSANRRAAFDQPVSRSGFQLLQPKQHETIKLSNRRGPEGHSWSSAFTLSHDLFKDKRKVYRAGGELV